MQTVYVRKRDRYTGRKKGLHPGGAPQVRNRAARRERITQSRSNFGGSAGGWRDRTAYRITRALRSLIHPKSYCPPGRHFGKHTKPVQKKGKR